MLVRGTSNFWNNFFLGFTREGAELLGVSGFLRAVTLPRAGADDVILNTLSYSLEAGEIVSTHLLTNVNIIRAGGLVRTIETRSEYSLNSSLDARVKIQLESHLPMQRNLLIRDEKEKVDNAIAEVFFENESKSTFSFDKVGELSTKTITSNSFCGQYPLIKKFERNKQFHKLLTSYDLRFFRFHLYITWRKYDSTKDIWTFVKEQMKIPKDLFWDFSLRFISLN